MNLIFFYTLKCQRSGLCIMSALNIPLNTTDGPAVHPCRNIFLKKKKKKKVSVHYLIVCIINASWPFFAWLFLQEK